MIKIMNIPFDPASEISGFDEGAKGAGAIVSFLGKVRMQAEGSNIRALELEHYPGATERSIEQIVTEARQRWTIENLLIIHRVGELSAGEPIVLVCVSAAHRRAAFEAADFLMDFLKTKAMFWKKEIRDDGEDWIEPRDADYQDAKRWHLKT